MSKTEILHLSSAKNKVSGAVKSDSDFIEYVRYGISFAEAFMTDHEVQRSEIVINQLAREMMGLIDVAFGMTRKYARLVKAMIKFPETIDRLENFFNGNVPERLKGRLGITHISATFFQEEPQNVEECWLVLESISRFVFEGQVDRLGAPSRRRRFSGSEFYAQVTEVLHVLRKCYEDYKEEGETFETFLKREVYFTRTQTESIRENFFTNMLTMQRTDSSGRNRAAVPLEKRIRNMYGEPEPPLTTTSRKGNKQTTSVDTIVETRGQKEARRRREARLRGEEEHVVTEAPPEQLPGETETRQRPAPTTTQAIPPPRPPTQTTNNGPTNASLDHTTSQPVKTPSLVETASVKTQETRGSNAGVHVGGVKDAREQSWRDEESEPEPSLCLGLSLPRGRLARKEKESLSRTVMMNPWMAKSTRMTMLTHQWAGCLMMWYLSSFQFGAAHGHRTRVTCFQVGPSISNLTKRF